MMMIELAGHKLAIHGKEEERMLERPFLGFAPFLSREGNPEWHVRYGEEVVLPEFEPDYEFDIAEGRIHCRIGSDEERFFLEMQPPFTRKPLLLCYDGGSTVACTQAYDTTLLRYSLWTATGMLGLKSGVQPIHSSTVVCDGRAVLFLGESGTGKSTQSVLWLKHIEGARLLNDDSPLITAEGEVYGSPWSGKTPCFENRHFPIAAIVRLVQAQENKMVTLSTIDGVAALHPSLPPQFSNSKIGLESQLPIVAELTRMIPIYRLECLPNEEAAILCHDTIFGTNHIK